MRQARIVAGSLVVVGLAAPLTAARLSDAAPPVASAPVATPPAVLAARLQPPSRASRQARLQAIGLSPTDPALATKLSALADKSVVAVKPQTVYPGPNGAAFGASMAAVKLATPATLSALKGRLAIPAATGPKPAHLLIIAGWPKTSTQFPFPEVAGERLEQLTVPASWPVTSAVTPTAIIETPNCGTYEVSTESLPPGGYVNYDGSWSPSPAPGAIANLDRVRLHSFLSLVDSPQVGKLSLYGNGKFSDTINVPLNPYPTGTTPTFSEIIAVSYDAQGNGVVYCSAPWLCGPGRHLLSTTSRLSRQDPCMVDTVNCAPPAIQGDDRLELNMMMVNGFRVTATLTGVDSFTDFTSGYSCYHVDDPCTPRWGDHDTAAACSACYGKMGPHGPNDPWRFATLTPATSAQSGVSVHWGHGVGESISYGVRFDFYASTNAVFRATILQPKTTGCAGER